MDRKEALKAKAEIWKQATDYFQKHFKVKMRTALFNRVFRSSIYTAHQGDREIARRKRQIERGILKVN